MNVGFGTPWQEQIDFLRQKLRLPTEKWDDIQRAAHDRAFMVAGAAKADLLMDLQGLVTQAAEQGLGQAQFLRQFKELVARHGWTGWTGEGSAAGQAWRARVIYQTNLAHSYAAGRWQQLKDPDFVRLRPYWRYVHSETVRHPRPQHLAWHGLTLRHDHEFWQTHFAPNGWGCRCRIVAVSRKEGEASAKAGLGQPPKGWDSIDPKTGAPYGIDRGFDYAPGANRQTLLRQLVQAKLLKLSPELAAALQAEVGPLLAQAAPAALPKPVFEVQNTAKAAADWAVKNNLADRADYDGVKPEAANAWNESLFNHLQDFPELRKNQRFVGTCQAQFALWREMAIDEAVAKLKVMNPGSDEASLRAFAENKIKPRKVDGNVWAHSWAQKDVAGVAVNKKYGADTDSWKKSLQRSLAAQWHPVGCDTIKSVIDHELGHQLDDLLGLDKDQEVVAMFGAARAAGMKNNVSSYADTNIKEFIAECWAESLNNPQPRPYATQIASLIRSRYASKYA